MERIYAIGDVHGDILRLKLLLNKYKLINAEDNWIGENSILVFIGDLTDRGQQGLYVIKLVMELEKQAKAVGGNVVSLCGNHDALIVATAYEYSGEESDIHCKMLFEMNGGRLVEAMSLARDDTLMDWMKQRPLLHKVQNILFQHADSCNYYLSLGDTIEEINEKGWESMRTGHGAFSVFYEMTDSRFFDSDKIQNEDLHVKHINDYLEKFGVDTIVHGHTRFIGNEAQSYYDGKIFNIDGSLSEGYRKDADRGFILDFSEIN